MGVRNYPDLPRFYVDMDGPLAAFDMMAARLGIDIKMLKRIAGVYRQMPVTTGAKEAIAALLAMGYPVFALTKIPQANPYAATEKLLWIHDEFPNIGENVIIAPDKGCVGTSRDFLVDDHPEWANAHNFEGTVLHFKDDWEEIIQAAMAAMGVERCTHCDATGYVPQGDAHAPCPHCRNGFRAKQAA